MNAVYVLWDKTIQSDIHKITKQEMGENAPEVKISFIIWKMEKQFILVEVWHSRECISEGKKNLP